MTISLKILMETKCPEKISWVENSGRRVWYEFQEDWTIDEKAVLQLVKSDNYLIYHEVKIKYVNIPTAM